MERLENVIFYTLDKAIKSYRQYAQKQLKQAGLKVTIDQWLILTNLQDKPEISQQELSARVFKDTASVTRIIDLLVKSGLLDRDVHADDRRRKSLSLTSKGKEILEQVRPVVRKNRATALEGLGEEDLKALRSHLQLIIRNTEEA